MFDLVRTAPGISPTSPSSGTINTISAYGSSTNENSFLIDGTDFTSPSNGAARADPGVDFVQEVHVQSVGASVEYGNVQGAVVNVVTRQGGNRFTWDASYYGQTTHLTTQPIRLPVVGAGDLTSGYTRAKYRDFTTNLGGPAVRDRLWFFAGYQYLRDNDSQPGTDSNSPRVSEEDNIFAKLTWRLAPGWQLVQSFHDGRWVNAEQPSIARRFETTLRLRGSVPAVTFAHLTHTWSANTVWDIRIGRFAFSQEDAPSTDNLATPNRFDQVTKLSIGAPPQVGNLEGTRTTAKATLTRYHAGVLADHEWKLGGQIDNGAHRSLRVIPTGVRFIDDAGSPFQAVSSAPSNAGGQAMNVAAFVSDAVTVGERLTINAGLRFDHSRATSQDLAALDSEGAEVGEIIRGLGTLYTWNVFSPRLGLTARLDAAGRTLLRASYGRYTQGVVTGEISPLHPGVTAVVTSDFVPSDGGYTRVRSVVDRSNLQLDPATRPPRTDAYSIGVDRGIGRHAAVAIAYVRKNGSNFIGWEDVGGQYLEDTRALPDGRSVPVLVLARDSPARLFRLTNPAGYSLTYDGLTIVVDKRRSRDWQAFASYTLSRAYGLQPSSGTTAAGAQVSTVGSPPVTFGRDPNDQTNAGGRLPNDRPHMFRVMGAMNVARTGLQIAGNLQYASGKPWAATALIPLPLPQSRQQRVLLEPRGSRRLSAQMLLDIRLSRAFSVGAQRRIELILDILNVLNDTAEEAVVTDDLFGKDEAGQSNFGRPNVFVDPRRAMVGVRLNLGR